MEWQSFAELMSRGGLMMWPLIALSLVGLTLILERAMWWAATNGPFRAPKLRKLHLALSGEEPGEALKAAQSDRSVYGRVALRVLQATPNGADVAAAESLQSVRPTLERFMPTLSTIITAAPMIGILGTVLGIIDSFQILSAQGDVTDPRAVSGGIAEALLTTAAGLVVAILVLFPYNAFRAQIDRTLGRLEVIVIAAAHAHRQMPATSPPESKASEQGTEAKAEA